MESEEENFNEEEKIKIVMNGARKISNTKAFEEQKSNILYDMVVALKGLFERNSPLLGKLVSEAFFTQIRMLIVDKDKSIRETAIRMCRYASINSTAFNIIRSKNVHVFISRCLERDQKPQFLMERFQAIKFVSHWLEKDPASLPRLFCQSLVAIGRHQEDNLKKPAIEILRKISIHCTNLCAWSGGIKLLIDSILDSSCSEISEHIVLTLLYLINEPKTRVYLKPYIELQKILSVFTQIDASSTKDFKKEILNKIDSQIPLAKKAVATLVKNWSGLIYLTSDPNGLRSLVRALDQPIRPIVKKAIFDVFFNIFNINMSYDEDKVKGNLKYFNSDNLLNTYMVMVLQAFYYCGIYDVLIKLATSADQELADLSRQLLKKLMQLSSILLPQIPQFPSLIDMASDFTSRDNSLRFRASQVIKELGDSYKRSIWEINSSSENVKQISYYLMCSIDLMLQTPEGVPYGNNVGSLFLSLRMQLDNEGDDSKFSHLLKNTYVTSTKDHTRWDWKLINELFVTQILKSSRLKEAMKSKFIKRLLSFYLPSKGSFITKPWCIDNFVYARVGYNLFKALLSFKKGRFALSVSPTEKIFRQRKSFLQEMSDLLEKEVKLMGNKDVAESAKYFSKEKLLHTMAREYLSWIGLFTQSKHGIILVTKFEIFNHLKKFADPHGRNDLLCMIIVNSFDYRSYDEPRNILQLWIEKGSKTLAIYIIEHLRILYRSGLTTFPSWCIDILVTQIYREDKELSNKAINVLKEVCETDEVMHALLSKWPQITKLQQGGDPFLARFLRSPIGLNFLSECQWIEQALERWRRKGNLEYVELIENTIFKELAMQDSSQKDSALQLYIPLDSSLDIRTDLKIFKRLPLAINLQIENAFNEAFYSNIILSYIETDSNMNMELVGKVLNKNTGSIEGFPIENHLVIKSTPFLGNKYINNHGKDINDMLCWSRCDYNDRKRGEHVNGKYVVTKNGISFIFNITHSDLLVLETVVYKIDILPRYLSEKTIPTHLFGEIAKTQEGIEMLKAKDHLYQFIKDIRNPECPILQKRASLWAIGHIGSSQNGLHLIKNQGIVPEIVHLAETSDCLSLRGTCTYVLGLFSKTIEGKKVLSKYKWMSLPQLGSIICLPRNSSKFFHIEPYQYKGDFTKFESIWENYDHVIQFYNFNEETAMILKNIGNLSNHVTQKNSLMDLKKTCQKNPELFMNIKLFDCVMNMMTFYNFRLTVRRYVYILFDKLLSSPHFFLSYDTLNPIMESP